MAPTEDTNKQPIRMRFKQWLETNRSILLVILQSWLFSRIALMMTAWFTDFLPKNASYQRLIDQGFQFTPIQMIDIWCRWDTEWYLSIAKFGYFPVENLGETYTNLAFFPLYPYLVRALTIWLPSALQRNSVILSVGLMLSNLFFILALWGIYQLTAIKFDERSALRAVVFTIALPGGFFFSAFYTESLFLFLIVFVFLSAEKEKWGGAAIFSLLATLTRAHGILILIPLAWFFISRKAAKHETLFPTALWFLLPPAGLGLHFLNLYRITGEPLAFFKVQSVWGRSVGSDFSSEFFKQLTQSSNQVAILDLLFILSAILISLWMLVKFQDKAYGIYALISCLVLLNSGRLFSMTRYTAVIFPVTMFIASRIKNRAVFIGICVILGTLQILMYAGWVNFYWIA